MNLAAFANFSKKGTEEEKLVSSILFKDEFNIKQLGHPKLQNCCSLCWNANKCNKIFDMIDKILNNNDYEWDVQLRTILLLHTLVLYGPPMAVDSALKLAHDVVKLQTYNSALIKKGVFGLAVGGIDYGGPVRHAAKSLALILTNDDSIRHARSKATEGQDSLVPMGDLLQIKPTSTNGFGEFETTLSNTSNLVFGQGFEQRLGTTYGLNATHMVPGLYEGRPERYFDNNDSRQNTRTGDSQLTRDAQAPKLIDLLDSDDAVSSYLPEAEYIPALTRQKELELQLQQQEEQIKLMQLQYQQQQQQHNDQFSHQFHQQQGLDFDQPLVQKNNIPQNPYNQPQFNNQPYLPQSQFSNQPFQQQSYQQNNIPTSLPPPIPSFPP